MSHIPSITVPAVECQTSSTNGIVQASTGLKQSIQTLSTPPVPPHGTIGKITFAPSGHQVARTERGQRGWGVHSANGELISSGWTTRTRALAYAAKLTAQAGA